MKQTILSWIAGFVLSILIYLFIATYSTPSISAAGSICAVDDIQCMQGTAGFDTYEEYIQNNSKGISENGIIGDDTNNFYNIEENEPGFMEKKISEMLISPANWILNAFGMKDVTVLVFGKNTSPTEYITDHLDSREVVTMEVCMHNVGFNDGTKNFSNEERANIIYQCGKSSGLMPKINLDPFLVGDCAGKLDCRRDYTLGIFNNGMMEAIDALYSVFELFLPFPIMIGLLVTGLFMFVSGMSSNGRTKAKDYAAAFIVALLSLRFGYYLWKLVAYIVQTFTDIIWAAMTSFGVKPNLFLNMVWGTGTGGYENLIAIKGLGIVLIVLAAAIMTFALNYQYILRTIMLMVLIVLFPITCTLAVFPRFRHALQIWWEEFISNMILPAAHALALGLFFLMLHYSSLGVSVWVIIAYFFGLPTIYNLIRKMVGAQESGGGIWGGVAGFAGLASIGALGKMFTVKNTNKAFGGNSPAGSGSLSGLASDSSTGDNIAIGGSSSPAKGRMAGMKNVAKGIGGKTLPLAGRLAGYGLKTAGAVGGFALGTMTGNAAAGAMVGGSIGGLAGKGANWTIGKALPRGISSASSMISNAKGSINSNVTQSVLSASVKNDSLPIRQTPLAESIAAVSQPSPSVGSFPQDYRPAGEDFWNHVRMDDHIDSRQKVVDLHHNGRLDRQLELEQAFSRNDPRNRNRDFYV